MQVLKEEVKDRILTAAEKIFYEQDYRSAKLTDIAEQADIPVALIYTYFKNKEGLFDEVVAGVLDNIIKMMEDEEKMEAGSPYERFNRGGASQLPKLLKSRIKLIILIDKSSGTKHENAKDMWVKRLEQHIKDGLKRYSKTKHDPMLAHILANNYVEGLMEIARHYKNDKWAEDMLFVLNKCYFNGVESL